MFFTSMKDFLKSLNKDFISFFKPKNILQSSKNFFTNYDWPTYIGFFIISFACLAFEVILNRMFALMFWYHFAFLIISIGLFGIGLGSLFVYFVNKFLKNDAPIVLAFLTVILAFVLPWVLLKVNTIPLNMDQLGKQEEQDALFRTVFLLLSIPFAISGFIFSFVFTNYKNDINRIYFFDLFGGGVGCMLALFIFEGRGPLFTSLILSFVLILGAAAFAFKRNKVLSFILLPVLVFFLYYTFYPQIFPTVNDKKVSREVRAMRNGIYKLEVDKKTGNYIYSADFLKSFPKRAYEKWDVFGYISVYDVLNSDVKMIMNNFNCFTRIIGVKNNKYPVLKDYNYPYVIKKTPDDVCIIGSGGGRDVAMALGVGAKNVYGAEFSKTIHDLFQNIYADFDGNIGNLPNVHVDYAEGRFYIRSQNRKYDVILFDNAIGIMAVTSGAFTLSEGYLYTVEGIEDYINHLKPGGVLLLSNPVGDMDRFITVIREAFKRLGRSNEFKDSLFVVDNQDPAYTRCKVLVKNGGFTSSEINNLVDFSLAKGDKLHYVPGRMVDPYIDNLVLTDDIEKAYEESFSEIRPSTDDWPFITQRMKPNQKKMSRDMKKEIYWFYPEPFLLLKESTKQVIIYSLLFLILPLFFLNLSGFKSLRNKLGSIVYFMCLGLGFMFIEIVLMQKYMLILGHPVYSFSFVLAGLLISSGVGSLFSNRIKNPYNAIIVGLFGIIFSICIFYFFFKYFSASVVGLSFINRVIITLSLTCLSGFFMGFMMPSGIRAVSKVESAIPWMWSINSVFSVVASFLSVYLSIIINFTFVVWIAVAFYTIGVLFFVLRKN